MVFIRRQTRPQIHGGFTRSGPMDHPWTIHGPYGCGNLSPLACHLPISVCFTRQGLDICVHVSWTQRWVGRISRHPKEPLVGAQNLRSDSRSDSSPGGFWLLLCVAWATTTFPLMSFGTLQGRTSVLHAGHCGHVSTLSSWSGLALWITNDDVSRIEKSCAS